MYQVQSTNEVRSFMRIRDVMNRVGLKHAAIYAKIKTGEFPAPLKIGRASRWDSKAIESWMDGIAQEGV